MFQNIIIYYIIQLLVCFYACFSKIIVKNKQLFGKIFDFVMDKTLNYIQVVYDRKVFFVHQTLRPIVLSVFMLSNYNYKKMNL